LEDALILLLGAFHVAHQDWISLDKKTTGGKRRKRNCRVKRARRRRLASWCGGKEDERKRKPRSSTEEPIHSFPKRPLGSLGSLLCEQPGKVQMPASRIQIHILGAHDPCAEPDLVGDVAEDDYRAS